jgi:ATP-dependent DNA helicase RecQ
MYQPLVENLMAHKGGGTSCVLTQTNEEAVILVALLRKHNIQSKLVQSMEGFRFSNLAEVRYLLKYIAKWRPVQGDLPLSIPKGDASLVEKSPLIPNELWEEAKHATFGLYEGSQSLPYVRRCVELFEQTNRVKYRTDLWEFIFESSVEDFCDFGDTPPRPSATPPFKGEGNVEVVVSTIHKAKGREFDDVYMLIADKPHKDEKLFRQLYVGMTRAKNRLFVHTNGDLFDRLPADSHRKNVNQYPMPEEVVLQLSHKDVNLGFFKPIKQEVLALRSGDALTFEDNYFYVPSTHRAVAKLSANMQSTLSSWYEKGYKFLSSSVRFVVAWKPKDAPKEEPETAVLLIDLTLSRE